ncbi:Alpha/Beta hydrolase protein [Aspergillus pseudoustus]|uniref:feruloyl esterase n=1 Tax=Aspergillus pseudoustus TaxID=1810923 RepID=A0ABR4KHN0_9EURO
MGLAVFLLGAICFVSCLALPAPTRTAEITPSRLDKLTLFSQYSAASSCPANYNGSANGLPVYCDAGYCALLRTTETEALYSFQGVLPGDTAGFIAADHTNKLLVVAFHDTMSRINGRTDLEFLQMDASAACAGCWAHSGFWQAAEAAALLLARLLEDARARYPSHRIVMTGHSLGGALATMYTVFLRTLRVYVDLYTFGAPSVGNLAFAEAITNNWQGLGTNYRVTHADDKIPKILFRLSRDRLTSWIVPEYSQSSPEYWIRSAYGRPVTAADIQVIEGVNNVTGNLGRGLGNIRDHTWYLGNTSVCVGG